MTVSELEHFRDLLLERENLLTGLLESLTEKSEDEARKVRELVTQIRNALLRVEQHTFGTCEVCRGEVELYRLEAQPALQVCLSCISDHERKQLEDELFVASKIHRALLPQTIRTIEGFDLSVRSQAAGNVGGDYFDVLPTSDGLVRIIIADTMGKGLPAGMLMSNLQGALRVLAEDIQSPAPLTKKLNGWLCRNVPVTKFISLTCIAVEPTSLPQADLVYANAGHCPGVMVRGDGTVSRLDTTGGVLGVHEAFAYEERRIQMDPDDLLVLFTDGASEAANEKGNMYGEDRLVDFVRTNRSLPCEKLVDSLIHEVHSFTGSTVLEDDCTILALRKRTTFV
jgi:sigma-B regulation protein RsbU (phosphoserine phosphatase)